MENNNLPEGYQTVYIFYPGNGTEDFFTAPNDKEAKELVIKERGEIGSAFSTSVIIKANGSYFFRYGGIPFYCSDETNIMKFNTIEDGY